MEIKLINIRHIVKKRLLLMIMKTFIFLLCTTAFSFTTENMFSQEKVMINHDQLVTIDEVFKIIKQQTDYKFIYPKAMFKDTPKVQLKKGEILVSTLLEKSLLSSNANFKLSENNTIVIKQKPLSSQARSLSEDEVQAIQVSGKVTDNVGMPLPGVTILIKGTSKGTVTDLEGSYTLTVPNPENVLVFSYLGYETQEILVAGKSVINVILKESPLELGEVLVTGYQTISRERATGSFSKLNTEDIKEQRPNSLSTLLEGRVVGYQNGLLRGTTSMNGLTTPLYVVDGFPIEKTRYNEFFSLEENLPDLNMEDIESITVLKDAAAASIYGARAANGVIVITTKKAKQGETNISFSSSLTYSPYNYYTGNLTDSGDIIGLEKEWAAGNPNLQATNGSQATYAASLLNNAIYTSQGMQTILNFYAGNLSESQMNNQLDALGASGHQYYEDMEKYAKRDQYYQQHNLSFGNATANNNFNASVTYKGNKYEDKYSENKSVGINLKNSTELAKWLTVDLGTYINFDKADLQNYNALSPGFKYQPYNRLVNADGTSFTSTAESRYNSSTIQSINNYRLYSMNITPMDEFGSNLKVAKDFSLRTYAKLNFKLSNDFKYNAMFQYEYGSQQINHLQDKESYSVRSLVNGLVTISPTNTAVYNLPYGDILKVSNQFSNAYNFRQQLNFDKIFNGVHVVSAIIGTETRHSKLEYNDNTRYGYDSQTLSFTPINQQSLLKVYGPIFGGYLSQNNFAAERELVNRYLSLFGNAGYTYDGKYTATGSLRWDRSNLWGTDNKYQNRPTWSAGASWNVDKETFFNTSWVDMLKLRFSYGIGGNIAKNSAPYLTAYYNPNNNVGGLQGSINSRPNPELSWEKTITTNIGVDFSIFKQRLRGTLDFYNKKSEDLLASSNGIPTEGWGYSTYTLNNGEMTNKGIEVSLNGTIIKTPSFSWDAGILYAHNKNEVTDVNVKAPVYYLQLDYPSAFPRIGNDFNSIYGYKWAGLSSTGLPQVYDATGTAVSYNPGNLEAIEDYGTTVPKQSGSFHTSVTHKNFSLSALFIYQLGHKMRNSFLPMFGNSYSSAARGYIANISAVNKRIVDRWLQPGDEAFTDVPRVVYEYDPSFSADLNAIYSYADINIIDASNVRLSNVSLAYQIPSDLTAKLLLKNIRLNFNVENILTMAKSKDAKYLLGGYQAPNFFFGLNANF